MNTQKTDNEKFKNVATKRFHDYFYPKVSNKELDLNEFFEAMGVQVNINNRLIFFSGMRLGQRSITLEHLQVAWDRYKVSPNYFFGLSDEPTSMLAEPSSVRINNITKEVGKIRKLLDEIEEKVKAK